MIFYRVQYCDRDDEEWLLTTETFMHDLSLPRPVVFSKIDLIRVVDLSKYHIFIGPSKATNYYRKL